VGAEPPPAPGDLGTVTLDMRTPHTLDFDGTSGVKNTHYTLR